MTVVERSFRANGGDGTPARLQRVEDRVETLETDADDRLTLLKKLVATVGEPKDGAKGPTGVFALLDDVTTRLTAFEKMRERAIGAVSFAIPTATLFGTFAWWAYGDTLGRVLKPHG